MTADESMRKFLVSLGATCRTRGRLFVLDGFDREFYLAFDAERDADDADSPPGTCDIYVVAVGEGPIGGTKFRVLPNATRAKVMRFMFALGVERFGEPTRKFLYESNSVIRTQETAI